MLAKEVTDEGQSARFASERAAANAKKKSIVGPERGRTEIADQRLPLFAPVFDNGANDVLAQVLKGIEVGDLARAEFLGEGKFRARPQPA